MMLTKAAFAATAAVIGAVALSACTLVGPVPEGASAAPADISKTRANMVEKADELSAPSPISALPQSVSSSLVPYAFEDVGTIYLPNTFVEEHLDNSNPNGLPFVNLLSDDASVHLVRYGEDGFDAMGMAKPNTVADFAQTEFASDVLPEGVVFYEDEYGDQIASYNGGSCFYALIERNGTYGSLTVVTVGDTYTIDDFVCWAAAVQLA